MMILLMFFADCIHAFSSAQLLFISSFKPQQKTLIKQTSATSIGFVRII
jgi:hypothetical protein